MTTRPIAADQQREEDTADCGGASGVAGGSGLCWARATMERRKLRSCVRQFLLYFLANPHGSRVRQRWLEQRAAAEGESGAGGGVSGGHTSSSDPRAPCLRQAHQGDESVHG